MRTPPAHLLLLPLLSASPAPAATEAVTSRLDALVEARLRTESVRPAAPAADEELVRRLYLDLLGRVPTVVESRRFLDSRSPDKGDALVEELLASPELSESWAETWTILLFGRGRLPRGVDREDFQAWLAGRLEERRPFDEIVREILTASGNPVEAPETNYLLRFERKPEDIAESVASKFLGLQIGCARCHDHPYESWTQEDFFGTAAAFAELGLERPTRAERRTRRAVRQKLQEASPEERRAMRRTMADDLEAVRRTVRLTDVPGQKLEVEIEGEATKRSARFLDGTVPKGAPREALAAWIVSKDNPYFSRAFVNRVWEALFGRGLVDPVDALGSLNAPSHPELLDVLAADFAANGFDLRRLLRIITTSDTYRRSSRYEGELPAPELYAVFRPRRMSPEQLFDSLTTVLGARGAPGFEERREQFYRRFVFLFDTDAVDDVEIAQGTLPQALNFLNGRMTNEATARTTRRGRPDVDELFLRALSRTPTAEERLAVSTLVASTDRRSEASADVLWALLNTSEFVLVH